MANEAIERTVDGLIASGRIPKDLRSEYIQHLEKDLNSHLLMGKDYTEKTQRLADDRRKAEAEIRGEYQKVQAEKQRLLEWQSQVQGDLEDYNKVIRQVPELTAKIASYEQLAKDYGIPDQVIPTPKLTEPPPTRTPNMTQPTPEIPKDGLSREEAGAYMRDLIALNGKQNRISAQHQRLYGVPLEDDLVTHYLTTGQDMEEHWKVKYGVEQKKAELAAKEQQAFEAKIREEERAKLMAEIATDPSRVVSSQPFHGAPSGGVAPHLERFMHSRALAHSQAANDDPALKQQGDFIPPEMRPEIASRRERIKAAELMYQSNFDNTGRPTTEEGTRLYRKHFVTD